MTPEQKESCNRYLCAWEGRCWHEWDWEKINSHPYCLKCGMSRVFYVPSPDYFNEKGFFLLWNLAKGSREWHSFIQQHGLFTFLTEAIYTHYIDPQVFPYEWAKFLGWKEE